MAFVHLLPTKVSLTLLQAIHHTTVYFLAMHLLPRCTSTADTPHPFSNATPHCAFSHCIVQCNFAPKVHSILLRQCISLETGGTRISLFATSTSGAKEGEKQT